MDNTNLSKKQQEIVTIMAKHDSEIIFIKGYNPSCFFSHNLSYKIYLPTMFKLQDLGYFKEVKKTKEAIIFKLK